MESDEDDSSKSTRNPSSVAQPDPPKNEEDPQQAQQQAQAEDYDGNPMGSFLQNALQLSFGVLGMSNMSQNPPIVEIVQQYPLNASQTNDSSDPSRQIERHRIIPRNEIIPGSPNHRQTNRVSDSRTTSDSNVYWVDAGSAEVIIEVMGEHVPVLLLQIRGVKICQIKKKSVARALCVFIVFAIVSKSIATIIYFMLRNAANTKNIRTTLLPSMTPTFGPTTDPFLHPSHTPTFSLLDNDERTKNISAVIFNVSGDVIYDPKSPQGQSFRWILKHDKMKLNHSSSNIVQRYSVMAIFFSLNGPNWFVNSGYGSDRHECHWYGVKECLFYDDISRLDLSNNGLQGTIPNEIILLSKLRGLSLGNNRISGTIPRGFTNLEALILSNNVFTGTIPELLQPTIFEAEYNLLTGTIPAPLMNYKQLAILRLRSNRLTGSFPKIVSPSSRLKTMHLMSNEISGTIPSEIGLFTAMKIFRIENNKINNTIPTNIGNLFELEKLYLHSNMELRGTIPSEIGTMKRLESLRVYGTMLTGVVPDSVCQLTSNVLTTFLADCKPATGGVNCSCCTRCF